MTLCQGISLSNLVIHLFYDAHSSSFDGFLSKPNIKGREQLQGGPLLIINIFLNRVEVVLVVVMNAERSTTLGYKTTTAREH